MNQLPIRLIANKNSSTDGELKVKYYDERLE